MSKTGKLLYMNFIDFRKSFTLGNLFQFLERISCLPVLVLVDHGVQFEDNQSDIFGIHCCCC